MRQHRIYQNVPLSPHEKLTMDEEASHYIIHVLRLNKNHPLILFNGDGRDYPATISRIEKRHVSIEISDSVEKNLESPLLLHLGQVIAKGDKMDLLIQKATELGIREITPLYSQRCEVHLDEERLIKKMQHWQKVIISACEQCGRAVLPELFTPQRVENWVGGVATQSKFVLDPLAKVGFKSQPSFSSATLLIGPEGGLTREEIDLAIKYGFVSVSLGPRILRTETAGLTAITCLQFLAGDLG